MKNEALERECMAAEDTDAPDNEQRQQQQNVLTWQMYFDESFDPPVPWWFNSVTGASTWECPVTEDAQAANEGSLLALTTGESFNHCEERGAKRHGG